MPARHTLFLRSHPVTLGIEGWDVTIILILLAIYRATHLHIRPEVPGWHAIVLVPPRVMALLRMSTAGALRILCNAVFIVILGVARGVVVGLIAFLLVRATRDGARPSFRLKVFLLDTKEVRPFAGLGIRSARTAMLLSHTGLVRRDRPVIVPSGV